MAFRDVLGSPCLNHTGSLAYASAASGQATNHSVACVHSLHFLILAGVIVSARMWRLGPDAAYSPLHGLALLCLVVALLFIGLSVCIGPSTWVPFHNRPLSMALIAAASVFNNAAGHTGSVSTLHPPVPHASIRVPLARAVLETIRTMDTLTDASMIKLLWQQVGSPVHSLRCQTDLA